VIVLRDGVVETDERRDIFHERLNTFGSSVVG